MRYNILIRSRHGSHDSIRKSLPKLDFRGVVRLGSTTTIDEINRSRQQKRLSPLRNVVECNTINAIKNSSPPIRTI